MYKINYKYVFYTTVFIFIGLFFFLTNDWMKRILLLVLAITLFMMIAFLPKKMAGISVIIVFIAFEVIGKIFTSN